MRTLFLALLVSVALASPAQGENAPGSPNQRGPILSVSIEGATLEPSDTLARFLGLVPGAIWDDDLHERVAQALASLGYLVRAITPSPVAGGFAISVQIDPARQVRHVYVRGNWPVLRAIFDEDVLRRMTLRPGARLPVAEDTQRLLDDEAQRIREYLWREGFFDADAVVVVKDAGRPEWVDLEVLMHLGAWFDLGHVQATGVHAMSEDDLAANFRPRWWRLSYLGRFRVDQMHEDARRAEDSYHDLAGANPEDAARSGYPGARVFPDFDRKLDVDHKAERVRLRLRVTEKGHVALRFVGNRALTDSVLADKVTIFTVGSYDETELAESAKELHRLYQSHGFLEAHVRYHHERQGDEHLITFTIVEGPELKVRAVDFVNEQGAPLTFTDDELQKQIVTKIFPLIGEIGLGEGGYVTSVQLAQDADKLVAFYRTQGFPSAHVRGEIARDPAAFGSAGAIGADVASGWGHGQDAYVRFFVEEGHRELIESVEFRFAKAGGRPARSAEELARALKLGAGSPFASDALDAGLKRVKDLYQSVGHPSATVGTGLEKQGDVEVVDSSRASRWNADHTQLKLVILVDEGAEVRFGEILLRGNFRTSEWAIRQDLTFKTGDLYDALLLEKAARNLQTHTIFNTVRVTRVPPTPLPPGTTSFPILVEVQERYDDWGYLESSFGYATDVGAEATLAYFWGNVAGGGGQLELRGDIAADILNQTWTTDYNAPFWRRIAATLRYSHPHLLFPSLRGEISAVARKESTPALGEVVTFAARAALTWAPSTTWRVFGRVDFSDSSLASIDLQRLPSRNDVQPTTPDPISIGKFTLGVVYDGRTSFDHAKNPLLPVEGSLLAVQATLSPFFGNDFFVFTAQGQRYQPLSHAITLIANFRGDWGVPLGNASALPAVERFFAGGDDRTRGYGTDSLKTEIVKADVGPAPGFAAFKVIPEGGNVRFLSTVELQFPVATLGALPWVGAVFIDAGSVFDDARLFDFSRDVKFSVGVTLLRILTPVGPISLEYAYPLAPSVAEDTWKKESWYGHWPGRIHFNWGIPILR